MFSFIRVCIMCMLMLLPATAWATHQLQVKDSATEGKGNYLLEFNGDYIKANSLQETKLTSIITAGAGEQVDLSVAVPYRTLDPSPVTDEFASGTGDLRFKLKQQLFENEVKQSMAYEIYLDMPTGDADKGLGNNNIVWGFNLIDTQECHDNAFHLNVGYAVFGRDVKKWHFARNYAVQFGLAAEHKFTESFRLLTEISGETREEAEVSSRPFSFLAGVVYDISKSWYVDLGMRAGLNKYAEDYTVLAGTALRF